MIPPPNITSHRVCLNPVPMFRHEGKSIKESLHWFKRLNGGRREGVTSTFPFFFFFSELLSPFLCCFTVDGAMRAATPWDKVPSLKVNSSARLFPTIKHIYYFTGSNERLYFVMRFQNLSQKHLHAFSEHHSSYLGFTNSIHLHFPRGQCPQHELTAVYSLWSSAMSEISVYVILRVFF